MPGPDFAPFVRQNDNPNPPDTMLTREDIQRLIHLPKTDGQILSVFLDMSVDSNNKRSHTLFLNQQRSQFGELESDRANHHREPLGAAFERIETWLDEEYREACKGVALFIELGGDWMESFQLPVPLDNRMTISERPIVGPLAQLVEKERRRVVALVDREHFRMLAIYLGQTIDDYVVETEPYPTPHDVQKGGSAQKDYQKWKAEETRQFYRDFAHELGEFVRKHETDDLILLGTDENVKHFIEFLPQQLATAIVHTAHGVQGESATEILARVEPFLAEQRVRTQTETVTLIHDRVRNHHLASSGVHETLVQLQEGKVDRLVVAMDMERKGAQCQRCGFFLARQDASCPYCGGETNNGVDIVEAMIRMASEQQIPIEFADPGALSELKGVGAFLKF
jgi:peptide subunit release factor 1 (eRF1)